ncbi:hypothetical protein A3C17_01450 [Candidatus Uhrbacteria bacterium RIFCSPHIGHO2_02_FULL_53_13]|uniref:Transposase IS200-like domain-containing protein n=2 Tax=Candidatus Uhriibacteriota TaxID=1752732 RepID=A0A1F7TZ01_9BACT|nr:MAG: hypothetical protein A3C17_01450 [Candidatus Uhrbacteria bacterium RIFCSPHIGHO2_02_FULL_53_13]
MARPLRIEFAGALYHVTSRGNVRQKIFLNDSDRIGFLKNLAYCLSLHNAILHAYCLMGNHYHLLVETPDANLSAFMRDINGNYTQGFNYHHRRVGHLFQGRYKAFVIDRDSYLFEVARYIVLNPVRAKFVKHPRDWKWSSYNATAGHTKIPEWLTVNWVLDTFSKDHNEAQRQYRQHVKNGIDAGSPFDDMREGVILGDEEFIFWIWETRTKGSEKNKEIPRNQRIVGRPTLEKLFEDIQTLEDRNAIICFAHDRCGYPLSMIAKHVKLDASTVGKIARRKYNQE